VGLLLSTSVSWRQVYALLARPGRGRAGVFLFQLQRKGRGGSAGIAASKGQDELPAWNSFFVLTVLAALQGFIYSALMSFLPRYLSQSGPPAWGQGNFLASGVLLLGCVGQDLAGRWARPGRLEQQLTLVTLANAPLLAWMAVATGWGRAWSAGMLALVHFMHQPLYNTLIATYTPRERRSLCYGFSFAMGLGLGSFGAGFAGVSANDRFIYGTLSGVAIGSGAIGLWLCLLQQRRQRAARLAAAASQPQDQLLS
jgi:hypothetical protein